MSAQLSKLHVRYIQTQKYFYLSTGENTKNEQLSIAQLYVKDNDHFYLINNAQPIEETQNLNIDFKEPTPALDKLSCSLSSQNIPKESEEFEDALLFFNEEAENVTQILLLTIQELK